MSRTITPNELKPLVKGHSIAVFDVRRKNDYDADKVKLPSAEWKDPEKIAEWSKMLPAGREVVIYCARGGSVSNSALDHLLAQGVNARFIEGGIEAWKQAQGDTVSK